MANPVMRSSGSRSPVVMICVIVVIILVFASVSLVMYWKRAAESAQAQSASTLPTESAPTKEETKTAEKPIAPPKIVEAPKADAPKKAPESPNKMAATQLLDAAKKSLAAIELDSAEKHLQQLQGLTRNDPGLTELDQAAAEMFARIAELRKKAEASFRQGRIDQHKAAIEAAGAEIEKLTGGRVRRDRIVEQLTQSAPDGVFYRSLVPVPDSKPSRFYRDPLGGKRVVITIKGYSEGPNPKEMDLKITELLNSIRTHFGIPKDGDRPPTNQDGDSPDWGFNKSLGARFDPPRLLSAVFLASLYMPPAMTPEQQKAFTPSTKALDIQFTLSFELPK